MKPIIVAKNKDVYKIVTAVLIALIPVHPFFTLHFDWPVILKCVAILGFLGFKTLYVFEENKEFVQINLFSFKISKSPIFNNPVDYLLIHKSLNDTKYELRLGAGQEFKVIVLSKDYFYISNIASQLSHLLQLDLYNPFEDYD
jgi:hypothetical protein